MFNVTDKVFEINMATTPLYSIPSWLPIFFFVLAGAVGVSLVINYLFPKLGFRSKGAVTLPNEGQQPYIHVESNNQSGGITTYGVKAPNRKILIEWVDSLVGGSMIENSQSIYLSITDCNQRTVDYRKRKDVPEHSVPCKCGNPNHYIIYYSDDFMGKNG